MGSGEGVVDTVVEVVVVVVGGTQFGSGLQPAPDLLSDLTDMLTPEPIKPGLH